MIRPGIELELELEQIQSHMTQECARVLGVVNQTYFKYTLHRSVGLKLVICDGTASMFIGQPHKVPSKLSMLFYIYIEKREFLLQN